MTRLNETPRVDLDLTTNRSVAFAVEWWADDGNGVAIDSVLCAVKGEASGDTLLDLAPHFTIADNVATVLVPAAATADLEPMDRGVWDLALVSDQGETRQVCRGTARIHRAVA